MRRDRRLAVTARAPGLGLTVDYTSTVVPPTSATSSRGPKPVTRVTSLPPVRAYTDAGREVQSRSVEPPPGLGVVLAMILAVSQFALTVMVALCNPGPLPWLMWLISAGWLALQVFWTILRVAMSRPPKRRTT